MEKSGRQIVEAWSTGETIAVQPRKTFFGRMHCLHLYNVDRNETVNALIVEYPQVNKLRIVEKSGQFDCVPYYFIYLHLSNDQHYVLSWRSGLLPQRGYVFFHKGTPVYLSYDLSTKKTFLIGGKEKWTYWFPAREL
ncbi:MAG: hypothetical protein KDK65_05995 [Chlamydiia bacterium]|nr:hypothetical protein [Chlamydiia bacterium]